MSDILIRGMEMPEVCAFCWFCLKKDDDHICGRTKESLGNFAFELSRGKDCPLVPVPPHGRLIDADALKKKRHWTDDFYETEYVEVEDIDAAPTIIPEEEGET